MNGLKVETVMRPAQITNSNNVAVAIAMCSFME